MPGWWPFGRGSCDPEQVCKWIRRIAPIADIDPPPAGHRRLQPNEFWMTEFYADYVDLRKAVVQLESIVHCDRHFPGQSGRPFLRGAQVAEPVLPAVVARPRQNSHHDPDRCWPRRIGRSGLTPASEEGWRQTPPTARPRGFTVPTPYEILARNSRPVSGRSPRSLASARSIPRSIASGRSGRTTRRDRGWSRICLAITA